MGRKKDRQRKANARSKLEHSRKETQKMIDRIMSGQSRKMKGAI